LTLIVESDCDDHVAFWPEVDVANQRESVAMARDSLANALALFRNGIGGRNQSDGFTWQVPVF